MLSTKKRTLFSFSGTTNNDKGRTAKGELGTGFSQMITLAASFKHIILKHNRRNVLVEISGWSCNWTAGVFQFTLRGGKSTGFNNLLANV